MDATESEIDDHLRTLGVGGQWAQVASLTDCVGPRHDRCSIRLSAGAAGYQQTTTEEA
jgi:hypothetical protein